MSDGKTCITLSGGLDSSIITAVASKQKKIDTYLAFSKIKNLMKEAIYLDCKRVQNKSPWNWNRWIFNWRRNRNYWKI